AVLTGTVWLRFRLIIIIKSWPMELNALGIATTLRDRMAPMLNPMMVDLHLFKTGSISKVTRISQNGQRWSRRSQSPYAPDCLIYDQSHRLCRSPIRLRA